MDTLKAMRPFCDGNISVHNLYALLESMGHSYEDCVAAFSTLVSEPGSTIRIGSYQKGEYHAEIYLSVKR